MATMSAPESGVAVRMYRLGYTGDCFLLAFRAADGAARYMLVDCGVYQATSGSADHMRAVVQDIAEATGGTLHVLAVTHEHWDHTSGFHYAKKLFDKLTIHDVWLAWTEDPHNDMARRLRDRRHAMALMIREAAARLQAAGDPMGAGLEGLLGFNGPGLGIRSTREQMAYVASLVERPKFCKPGQPPLSIPNVEGVSVWVLGPPQDEALLSRSDPRGSEAYEDTEMALNPDNAFFGAALSRGPTGMQLPFDEPLGIPMGDLHQRAEHAAFFEERYGSGEGAKNHPSAWRRIDADWLLRSGQLALDLDGDTNNTSLVLAIELVPGGRVLLFPGDAQVGNWLSWQSVAWSGAATGGEPVHGSDLLKRTVLYKVGHHGSHNATLRAKGLELMESQDLMAMIPVEEEHARSMDWEMPFEPLLRRLTEKTKGRIIRADRGVGQRPAHVRERDWERFLRRVTESELWVELVVGG